MKYISSFLVRMLKIIVCENGLFKSIHVDTMFVVEDLSFMSGFGIGMQKCVVYSSLTSPN